MNKLQKFVALFLLAIAVVLSLVSVPNSKADNQTPGGNPQDQKVFQVKELLAKAEEQAQFTSWDRAIDYYEQVLAILPDYFPARMGMAGCYEKKKVKDKAVATYLLIANAKDVPNNQKQEATVRIEKLLLPSLASDQEDAYEFAGALLQKASLLKGQEVTDSNKIADYRPYLTAAIVRLEKLRSDLPEYIPLYLDLGLAYELLNRNNDAIIAYKEYLRRHSLLNLPLGQRQRDVRIRATLLEFDVPNNRPIKEETELASIKDAVRVFHEALNNEEFGQYTDAIKLYAEVVKKYPANYQARFRLGQCLKAVGDKSKAIEQFRIVSKNSMATESIVTDCCELVEKLSCPELAKEQEETLKAGITIFAAAKELYARTPLMADRMYYTLNPESAREMANNITASLSSVETSMVFKSIRIFESVRDKQPEYMLIYLHLGRLYQFQRERGPGSRLQFGREYATKARAAYDKYLEWYKSLDIPETSTVSDIRRRREEIWDRPQ